MNELPNEIAIVDIETLGLTCNSVVLSMSIAIVNPYRSQAFEDIVQENLWLHFCFNKDEQLDVGRTICDSTEKWWNNQHPVAQECLYPFETIKVTELRDKINSQSLDHLKSLQWYARGPHFDIAILDKLFQDLKVEPLWHYGKIRDIHTLEMFIGRLDKRDWPEEFVAHHSAHDAALEGYAIQYAMTGKLVK